MTRSALFINQKCLNERDFWLQIFGSECLTQKRSEWCQYAHYSFASSIFSLLSFQLKRGLLLPLQLLVRIVMFWLWAYVSLKSQKIQSKAEFTDKNLPPQKKMPLDPHQVYWSKACWSDMSSCNHNLVVNQYFQINYWYFCVNFDTWNFLFWNVDILGFFLLFNVLKKKWKENLEWPNSKEDCSFKFHLIIHSF